MSSKLLNSSEQLVYITGIFTEVPALEHEGVGGTGGVSHFAVAYDSLVGVDLDQGAMLGSAVDVTHAKIGDLQLCGR